MGALLLYQFGYLLSDHWPGAMTGMEGAPASSANVVFVFYALILAAPGAAGFGALGSWLLIRKRDRGTPRAALYRYGALSGIASGLLCLPISVLILAIPFVWVFHAGTLGKISGLVVWLDPRNPLVVVAGITGLILGLATAWIVAHSPAEAPDVS
jgi:hypothetical protein